MRTDGYKNKHQKFVFEVSNRSWTVFQYILFLLPNHIASDFLLFIFKPVNWEKALKFFRTLHMSFSSLKNKVISSAHCEIFITSFKHTTLIPLISLLSLSLSLFPATQLLVLRPAEKTDSFYTFRIVLQSDQRTTHIS